MSKGAIAGIIVGVIVGAIVGVSFAFPQALDRFSAKISQPTSAKETANIASETKDTAENIISKPTNLDQVDPYYKTTTIDSGKVTKMTQDKSKCTISFLKTGPPIAAEFQFKDEEIDPCPFILGLDVIKYVTCLSGDAPVDLRLKVQPQCKTVYEQKGVGNMALEAKWINPRPLAENCGKVVCPTVGDGIRVALTDPYGIKHDGKITIYGAASDNSKPVPVATKTFDSVDNASWDFIHFQGGNRVIISYIEAEVQYGPTIKLTMPENVEIIPNEEKFVWKCMFGIVGYGAC